MTAVPLDGDRLREIEADASSPFASIRTRGVSALVAALRASWAEVERLTAENVCDGCEGLTNNIEGHCDACLLDGLERDCDRLRTERDEARAALAAAERTLAEVRKVANDMEDERSAGLIGRVRAAERIRAALSTFAASRTGAADKENDHA